MALVTTADTGVSIFAEEATKGETAAVYVPEIYWELRAVIPPVATARAATLATPKGFASGSVDANTLAHTASTPNRNDIFSLEENKILWWK